MSELVPALVALDKGLNLQTAKIIAPPGSVLDGLNYEQVDFQGQKRIDGYARYDGSILPAVDDYYIITTTTATVPAPSDERGLLVDADGNLLGRYMRYPGDATDTKFIVAWIDFNHVPVAGDVLDFRSSITYGLYSTGTVASITTSEAEPDTDTQYENLLALNSFLREVTEALPGPIIGLHWFRDRLYAVADVLAVSIDGTTPEIFPNDELLVGSLLGTALGSITLDDTRVVFLNIIDSFGVLTVGDPVTRDAVEIGTIADGFQEFATDLEVASFFESRTEKQVLEEDSGPYDFGWRFVHQGWAVDFENGTSLFGSFPSLNQNIQGLGVQGPTSTTGNNGRPLVLQQKVNITNAQTQVNGWKSTATPTTYLLDPDNLTDVDTDYIYADAFITWDATTGVVSAPGITTTTIPEYSASATVEVDV